MRKRILSKNTSFGKISVKWTLTALTFSYLLIVVFTTTEYFICQRNINYLVTVIGFFLYLTGLLAREIPVKILGRYWSPNVEIREDQSLIKEGIYRYLRHPYYLLLLLELLGFTLVPNAYYTFFICLIFYTFIIYLRIWHEEKALIERFGQEYIDYKKEVPGLIPLKKKKLKDREEYQ